MVAIRVNTQFPGGEGGEGRGGRTEEGVIRLSYEFLWMSMDFYGFLWMSMDS
jgi:hypothetical protein